MCDAIATLTQRFGRAARDPDVSAICILLIPSKFFEEERRKKEQAAKHRKTLKAASVATAANLRATSSVTTIANDVAAEAIHNEENTDDSEDEYVPTLNASVKKRKRGPVQVSEEVDAFINAGRLPSKDKRSGCRRKVLIEHFGTDYIRTCRTCHITFSQSDFHAESPLAKPRPCCPRCDLRPPSNGCCDLCTPSTLANFLNNYKPPPRPARGPSATKTKPFDMGDTDIALRDTLRAWRKARFIEQNGGEWVPNDLIGSRSFMSNDVLLRIVALTHCGEFSTREALLHDVDWVHITTYADDLLKIMTTSRPRQPDPPPAPVLAPRGGAPLPPSAALGTTLTPHQAAGGAPLAKVRQPQRCGKCRLTGHNSRSCSTSSPYRSCIKLIIGPGASVPAATTSVISVPAIDKENHPPA